MYHASYSTLFNLPFKRHHSETSDDHKGKQNMLCYTGPLNILMIDNVGISPKGVTCTKYRVVLSWISREFMKKGMRILLQSLLSTLIEG